MASPAQVFVDALYRLRARFPLRRARVESPAAEQSPLPAPDHKRWKLYYDKARWPGRDYPDKGLPPHG